MEETLEIRPIVIAKKQPGLVETPYVENLVGHALKYVHAGYPVHFSDPAAETRIRTAEKRRARDRKPAAPVEQKKADSSISSE